MPDSDRSLAIFIDFENLALGFQGRRDRFDIERVLERLVEKGKVVAKKAYADWSRFSTFTSPLHEAAIELIEIPRRALSGKNSADIRLCVDAMDLAYSKEHIDTFVVVSGDSDFSPLVSKLKELGKHVIGLGMQESTSDLLRDNCDEFIYYEDLGRAPALQSGINPELPENKRKGFALLMESLLALRRENKEVLWSSMVKDTMKRKKPSFNESYHGYRTFSELLEDAKKEGLLELDIDKRSRTYVVTAFGAELNGAPAASSESSQPRKKTASRRRRSSKGRRDVAIGKPPAAPAITTAPEPPVQAIPDLSASRPSISSTSESEKPTRRPPDKPEKAHPRQEETGFGKGLDEPIPY
ncbi:MAG: NYN domain-containing protein [Gemmataceae bacterium]